MIAGTVVASYNEKRKPICIGLKTDEGLIFNRATSGASTSGLIKDRTIKWEDTDFHMTLAEWVHETLDNSVEESYNNIFHDGVNPIIVKRGN